MASSQRSGIDFRDEGSLHSRFFKISTEQQIIISKDSAWLVNPSNIPPIVLDNVKEHFARQRERTALTELNASPDLPDGHQDGSKSPAALHEVEAFDSQPEDFGDGDDEPYSQWESSPTHHRFPPGYVTEEMGSTVEDEWVGSAVYSTNPPTQAHGHAVDAEMEDDEPLDDFLTQLPERSPPQPTATKSSRPSRPIFEFPSSSLGQEDEMEVDIPTRLGVPILPMNPAFAPVMATPPSAQIVPCSLDPQGLHLHHEHHEDQQHQPKPRDKPGTKQMRYAPVTTLYRPPKDMDTLTKPGTSAPKGQLFENDKSSLPHTFSDISSSIVPSTHQDSNRPMDMFHNYQEQRSQVQDSPTNHETQAQPLKAIETNAELFQTQEYVYQDHAPLTAQLVLTTNVKKIVDPQSHRPEQDLAPYRQFCETYRDYTGDIRSFITACFYIQLQQKKIRSSLYDDFIRAWHDGYYAYVKRCDRADPPVKAVHAYAWYNEMDDDPIYTARVVTKLNLEATLNVYPEIVNAAQKTLGIIAADQPHWASNAELKAMPVEGQKRTQELRSPAVKEVGRPLVIVAPPPPPQQPEVMPQPVLPTQDPIIIDDVDEDDDSEDDIPIEDPQAAIFSRHQQRRASPPLVDFSKSMSEIDLRRQLSPASEAARRPTARPLARSLSEASKHNHKRKTSAEVVDPAKAARRASPTIASTKPNKTVASMPAVSQAMRPPPRPAQPEQQSQAAFPSLGASSTHSNLISRTNTSVSRPEARMSLPAAVETPSSSAISLSFYPPSSTAGSTTSTMTRKRRYANDPEKRRLMFKKFCERGVRKVNEESIMSSAPTSAQRE